MRWEGVAFANRCLSKDKYLSKALIEYQYTNTLVSRTNLRNLCLQVMRLLEPSGSENVDTPIDFGRLTRFKELFRSTRT